MTMMTNSSKQEVEAEAENVERVVALDDGYDEAKLKECGVKPTETLPQQALQFLTPGIWASIYQGTEEEKGLRFVSVA